MLHLFSDDSRYQTWRRLWTALARAQHQLGLPITEAQVAELEAHITDIDYEEAARRERQVRHDVMAHVYAYGKAAPSAAGIIHLGATSCYVTDNADLILYRDGLVYLRTQLLAVLGNLAAFAEKYWAVTEKASPRSPSSMRIPPSRAAPALSAPAMSTSIILATTSGTKSSKVASISLNSGPRTHSFIYFFRYFSSLFIDAPW